MGFVTLNDGTVIHTIQLPVFKLYSWGVAKKQMQSKPIKVKQNGRP